MRTKTAIPLVFLLFAAPGSAGAQGVPLIPPGPHWSAAELRAAHGAYESGELQILASLTTDQDPARKSSVVSLGPDYLSVSSESGQTIIDTKLKRLMQVDRKAKVFVNNSLYAPAAFVQQELRNRLNLRGGMERAGVTAEKLPDNLKTFWIESDLGAEAGEQGPPAFQRIDHEDGSVSILFEGDVVAFWKLSKTELSFAQTDTFRLFLQYHLKLHPRVRRAILAEKLLPERITYKRFRGKTKVEEDYRFRVLQRRPAAYPLARGLEPQIEARAGDTFHREVYPVMAAAVVESQDKGPLGFDAYLESARGAMGRGATFDAWLMLMEATLHHPQLSPFCGSTAEDHPGCFNQETVQNVLLKDARTRELQTALALKQRANQPERMLERLRLISRDGLSKGYMLDVFSGNTLSQRPDLKEQFPQDPAALIAAGIRRNPYVPTFYKDLGDHFARNRDFARAFICYDLGRALPDGGRHQKLQQISQQERDLERLFPDFF